MIKIDYDVVGMIGTNCYLIEDEASGALAVIDPGDHSDAVISEIDRRGGKLDYILLTHGHYDHVLGVAELCERYHPTVCAAQKELLLISEPSYNLSKKHGLTMFIRISYGCTKITKNGLRRRDLFLVIKRIYHVNSNLRILSIGKILMTLKQSVGKRFNSGYPGLLQPSPV